MNSDLLPIINQIAKEESTEDIYNRLKNAFRTYSGSFGRNRLYLVREAIECAMTLEYRMQKMNQTWLQEETYRANRVSDTQQVLQSKAIEYAKPGVSPEARYNNFIKAAALIDSDPYTCLCFFQLKHLASIDDLVTNTDEEFEKYGTRWEAIVKEKFGDFINYGILLIGMQTDPIDPRKES